jgi:hypothetical protein
MRVLGEAVDDSEDDRLAADFGQPFNEVHGDVRPHLGLNLQGLQQLGRLEGLRLVALACGAGPHLILNQGAVARDVEV